MKQKKQLIIFLVLAAIAVGIWYYQWYEPQSGQPVVASSVPLVYKPLNFPNPNIHWDQLDRRRKAEYKGSGVNPFGFVIPPTPDEVKKAAEQQASLMEQQKNVPPPLPPPPELPASWKFFGYGNVPTNTARRAFLEDGDEVYIVNEGDTLLGRFRILKINNATIEFEEVGSGRRGLKMLEDQGPAA